jgi:hypothetical protein
MVLGVLLFASFKDEVSKGKLLMTEESCVK